MATNVTAVQESGGGDLGDLDDNFISIHGRQVRNESEAIVTKITELDYVLRFLILGQTELSYVPVGGGQLKTKDETKVRIDIETLIKNGKGTTVVNLIKDISSNYRNISQDPVVYCLALCARSDDVTTKRAAYEILNDVCRIPTHLFQFIEYYTILTKERCTKNNKEDVERKEDKRQGKLKKKEGALKEKNKARKKEDKLKMKKINPHAAYGWGRLFKAAITKWFLSFEPEYLAYLLTKYRRRCGWSVKTVIRLAHIKSPDRPPNTSPTEKQRALGFILRYFRSNLKSARKEYSVEAYEQGSIVKKIDRMLEDYDKLRTSEDVGFIQKKIREDIEKVRSNTRQDHIITIEHLSTKVLARDARNVELWRDLIPCMPGDALVRHTGFLTNMGVWKNRESNEIITETVSGFETRLCEFIKPPTDPSALRPFTSQRPVHPFKLLTAMLQYKGKQASRRGLHWVALEDVTSVLQRAFEHSLGLHSQVISSTICVAIDTSGSMTRRGINGKSWAIKCIAAAQAVAFTLAKMGRNVQLLAFNENGHVALEAGSDFHDFVGTMKKLPLKGTAKSDCTEPLKWAQQQERKDVEAFVVFTVNENVGNRNEPVAAIKLYRDFSGNDHSKFIICTMNATKVSSSDPADGHMFDICGCDTNLPLLIQEFLQK